MADISARELAADSLMQILENGAFTSAVMAEVYSAYPDQDARERRLYTVLVEKTAEELFLIDAHLSRVSDVPVRKMKPFIRTVLRMSTCQILFLDRIPDHAAVSEAVRITGKRGFGRLKGFVNGVLRNLIRRKEEPVLPDRGKEPEAWLSVRYSCPEWMVKMWRLRYGDVRTEEILAAFHAPKTLCLWANPLHTDAQSLCHALQETGAAARVHPSLSGCVLVSGMDRIAENAAYRNGDFYIQDYSSVLVCLSALCLLQKKTREDGGSLRIIDVCGAPGGKSLYLAAHLPHAEVFCRDLTAHKTERIRENIRRLTLTNVTAQESDALVLREEDLETADLVIADLPCSGLGTIGRKADLRYRIRETDVKDLSRLQRRILKVVSQYVKPGGLLMYSTCTISERENEAQAAWIRESLPFEPVSLEGLPADLPDEMHTAPEGYLQILPHASPYYDGFFISLFRKEETDER